MWRRGGEKLAGTFDVMRESDGIFVACRHYTRQNPESYQYRRAHGYPVGGDVHQVCTINEAAEHDCEPD
jgi:hypothetical protein